MYACRGVRRSLGSLATTPKDRSARPGDSHGKPSRSTFYPRATHNGSAHTVGQVVGTKIGNMCGTERGVRAVITGWVGDQ
jgi:hypothetical protein